MQPKLKEKKRIEIDLFFYELQSYRHVFDGTETYAPMNINNMLLSLASIGDKKDVVLKCFLQFPREGTVSIPILYHLPLLLCNIIILNTI